MADNEAGDKLSFDQLVERLDWWLSRCMTADKNFAVEAIQVFGKEDMQALQQLWELMQRLQPKQRDLAALLTRRTDNARTANRTRTDRSS